MLHTPEHQLPSQSQMLNQVDIEFYRLINLFGIPEGTPNMAPENEMELLFSLPEYRLKFAGDLRAIIEITNRHNNLSNNEADLWLTDVEVNGRRYIFRKNSPKTDSHGYSIYCENEEVVSLACGPVLPHLLEENPEAESYPMTYNEKFRYTLYFWKKDNRTCDELRTALDKARQVRGQIFFSV